MFFEVCRWHCLRYEVSYLSCFIVWLFGPVFSSYIVKVCSVDWLLDMLLCILILLERYQRYL